MNRLLRAWIVLTCPEVLEVVTDYEKLINLPDNERWWSNPLTPLVNARASRLRKRRHMKWTVKMLTERGYPHPNWLQEILGDDELLDLLRFAEREQLPLKTGCDQAFAIWGFRNGTRFGFKNGCPWSG